MKTKYNYFKVIQQNYGQSWEDCSHYQTKSDYLSHEKSGIFATNSKGKQYERSLLAYDLEQYRIMGYPTRVINRKELKTI